MATSFFNLHTHYSAKKDNETAIVNFDVAKASEITNELEYFSVGIHPWFIKQKTLQDDLKKISELSARQNCAAIGECGLDRLKGESLELQIKVFGQQIEIANIAEKPLIIHCVRAFQELLAVKNEYKKTTPWIVHGFNGNDEMAQQLIKHGISISFGANLLTSQKLQKILKSTPNESFFLETDESDISIKELYAFAAELKNIKTVEMQKQLSENAIKCNL
jgi:TatD DNase family protein